MDILGWLTRFKYLAMFGILFLCGMGLPIPEEMTLVGSGLLVGWGDANFFLTSVACVLGILAGDSIIFGLGYYYGRRFLYSRPMRFLMSPRRQVKVADFFSRHGSKAVFFARFFAGVRIGVYAYAGSQRMNWLRFVFLDFLGAVISGPTSVLVGAWVATKFAKDSDEAIATATHMMNRFGHWVLIGAVAAVALCVIVHLYRSRRRVLPAPPTTPDRPPSPPEEALAGRVKEHELSGGRHID